MINFVKLNSNNQIIGKGFGNVIPEGCVEDTGIYEYAPVEIPDWIIAQQVLNQRSKLLQASDWTQLVDVPITNKTDWEVYRQALRDITDQSGYPNNITWPIPPQ